MDKQDILKLTIATILGILLGFGIYRFNSYKNKAIYNDSTCAIKRCVEIK